MVWLIVSVFIKCSSLMFIKKGKLLQCSMRYRRITIHRQDSNTLAFNPTFSLISCDFFPSFYCSRYGERWKNGIVNRNAEENNNWIIIFNVIYLPIAFILLAYFVVDPSCWTLFFRSIYAYLFCSETQFFVRWHQRLQQVRNFGFFCLLTLDGWWLMMPCAHLAHSHPMIASTQYFSKYGPFNLSIPLCSKYFSSL